MAGLVPALQLLADSRSHLGSTFPDELGSGFGEFQTPHGDSCFSDFETEEEFLEFVRKFQSPHEDSFLSDLVSTAVITLTAQICFNPREGIRSFLTLFESFFIILLNSVGFTLNTGQPLFQG